MANSVKTQSSVFTKEAVKILENNLVMAKSVHRDYESEFTQKINGYKKGETISIRRPADFTVRTGATRSSQDVVEGSTTLTIGEARGVDVSFTSREMTLDIDKSGVRERVLKPAMIQLANQIEQDIMALYAKVPNWAGTPGQTINSFADFAKGPERLDEFAVPMERTGVLSPADHWALLGSQTALYMNDVAKSAYRAASLGRIGGVDLYMAQNVPTHTVGVATGTPKVNGANQNVTWAASKDSNTQTLNTDGWTNSTTGILKAGDVITIAGVYAVNPVSKATLPFLRQFVVMADADSGASTGPAALTISPPIITSGSQKTCSAVPADNADITVLGTGGTGYRQNMVFHKNAFAFAPVPIEMPVSAVGASRESYKGITLRLVPGYDHENDVEHWRFDVLYAVGVLDPRLATRLSGTS